MNKELMDYMRNWHTKREILAYLSSIGQPQSERHIRSKFAKQNELYSNGLSEWFIAHSNNGYILTDDKSIIVKSLTDDRKRALKLLKRYGRANKTLADLSQLTLEPEEATLYDLINKMGA